jgi:hypothetical protein
MTESWKTNSPSGLVRAGLAAAVMATCALPCACSPSPTSPAKSSATQAGAATVVAAASNEQGTNQTWQDFQARGWNCRTPNNGPATVCSPPNQPLPTIAIPPAQPPADRPETVLLKRWINGVFNANVLLIRPEIYNGQPCESTGQSYSYIVVLGYFECAHTVGN